MAVPRPAPRSAPDGAEKSVDVRLTQWDGELKALAKAVASRTFKGDVIDLKLPRAVEACEKGLLEKIDAGALPSGIDGTRASADFVPGALGALLGRAARSIPN